MSFYRNIFLLFVGFHGLAEHFSGSFNLTSNVNKAVRSETLGWMDGMVHIHGAGKSFKADVDFYNLICLLTIVRP